MELDPHYVDVAVRRWQEFTGKSACQLGDGRSFDVVSAERLNAPRASSSKSKKPHNHGHG